MPLCLLSTRRLSQGRKDYVIVRSNWQGKTMSRHSDPSLMVTIGQTRLEGYPETGKGDE
jgi:hypothetical protein